MRWLVIGAVVGSASAARAEPDENRIQPPDRPRFGARIGASFSNIYDNVPGELADRTGLLAGAFTIVPLAGRFAIEACVAYAQKGAMTTDDRERLALDYLEAPVVLVGTFDVGSTARGRAFAGPSLAVNLDAGIESSNGTRDVMRTTADVDLGVVGGAGLELETGAGVIIIDLRIEVGLVDANSSAADVFNRVFAATVGFAY